jgi:RIO-like serine/threonine protein kinase
MELVSGLTLCDWVKKGTLDCDIATMMGKIAKQLFIMRDTANVLHRDLHSNNVMITDNNEPVILDFGYTKPWHRDEQCPIVLDICNLFERSDVVDVIREKNPDKAQEVRKAMFTSLRCAEDAFCDSLLSSK